MAKTDPRVTDIYRNPRATIWPQYRECLKDELRGNCRRPRTTQEIEIEVARLQTAIIGSYEGSCPAKQRKDSRRVPWWNNELSKLRTRARKLLNKAMKVNTEAAWASYKEAQKAYKSKIRTSKRRAWKDFCRDTEALPLVARLRRVFASGPPHKPEDLKLPSGGATTNPSQTLEHLIETHFPGSELVPEEQSQEELRPRGKSSRDWGVASKVVTVDRLRWAIGSFSRYKSPGVDGIFPALLQEGGEDLLRHLCPIYRACLALGYVPKQWRVARVVFLPKPGRSGYDSAKSFRPVSLTSFLLKTLERLVDRYLREHTLVSRPVHASQHAYQAGKSVETALHHLVREIEGALSRGESVASVFIDIEGAFDSTSFDVMREATISFGTDSSLSAWIDNMLRTRTIITHLDGTTLRARIARGCPQGGVLSPLLWTLVVDGLLRRLCEEGFLVQGYADDICISVKSKHPHYIARRLREALAIVQEWCLSHNLKVNPAKTELVLFSRKRSFEFKAPSLFGVDLGISTSVKYLGVTLDAKLSWKLHIEKQAQKALSTYWACRRMFGATWGLKPRIVRWIYTAIMVPQFTYASVVWWTSMRRKGNRRTLEKIYRLALLGLTGAFRTTPTMAMGALLDLAPPHIVVEAGARNAAMRLFLAGKWKGAGEGHASILRDFEDPSGALALGGDACDPAYHFKHSFQVRIPCKEAWETNREAILAPGGLVWYTDGSKTGLGTGAGIWGERPRAELSLSLGQHVSVLQAEVFAIWACAKLNLERGYRDKHIYICSDSKAALGSLRSTVVRSKLVQDCTDTLERLSENNNRVNLVWVPGHAGITGNEMANVLAREGAAQLSPSTTYHIGVAIGTAKEMVRAWARTQTHQNWSRSQGMRHTKALFKGPSTLLGKTLSGLERNQLRLLVGLITGHWYTRKHLMHLGMVQEPGCPRCGEEEETPLHLLTRCKGLEAQRRLSFGVPILCGVHVEDIGVGRLLCFAREAGLHNLPH